MDRFSARILDLTYEDVVSQIRDLESRAMDTTDGLALATYRERLDRLYRQRALLTGGEHAAWLRLRDMARL